LTKEQAKEIYQKWIKKRIFAPKEFKLKEEVDKITGIYAPSGSLTAKRTALSAEKPPESIPGDRATTNTLKQSITAF